MLSVAKIFLLKRKNWMEPSPDAFGKNDPAAKSREDLLRLLVKLNDLLREKLGLAPKKAPAPRQTDVTVIILTRQEEKTRPAKSAKPGRAPSPRADWMEDLFAEIEAIPPRRRKTS